MSIDGLTQHFLNQLDSIVKTYDSIKMKSKDKELFDLGDTDIYGLITRSRAAIERVSGRESVYSKQLERVLDRKDKFDSQRLIMIIGIVQSLRTDLQAGHLSSVSELMHGEVFADFLEMADYLLGEGYKDPAAVITGGTLEAHLRQLCIKNGNDTEITTAKGTRAKKADQMNAELSKKSIYSKLDHKNVTAWLDLRNKAAHARYNEYSTEQVSLMVTGVRDFITRNPA